MDQLSKNIKRNYLFVFISRFDLTQGMWMLFLAYKGLSLFEIGLMEGLFHASSFLMEIPTGAIADIYGRKTSRVLGRIIAVISTVIMLTGNSIVAFAISFFFSALSYNLESGAGDALVYDSLKETGQEKKYMKISGRNEMFYQITSTLSLLIGGYIATFSYLNVYRFAFVVGVISVVQALTFTEPSIGKVEKKDTLINTFTHQIASSFKVMTGNRSIIEMIIALQLFSTLFTTVFFYIQNYFKLNGKSEFEIGIILAIGSGIAAIFATQTYKLEKKISLQNLLKIISVIAIIAFWGITVKGLEPYAFFVLAGAEGVLFIATGDYVNKRIPSEKRATILSFQSMIFSIFMFTLFPLIGFIGDQVGLDRAFLIIAIISTLVLGIFVHSVTKKNNH